MLRGSEEGLPLSFHDHTEHARPPRARRRNDVGRWLASRVRDGPQGIARNDFLDGLCGAVGHEDGRPGCVAEPVTSGRRDAEDLRPGPVVRHGFLFDRVHVARDDPAVDVQPELAFVNTANPAQADLTFADLAVAGTRRAHDLVRALDRLPELGDFSHRLARRLPDIEDFRFRNHRPRYTGPIGLKHFVADYRIPEERKCSQPLARSGSLPVFVTSVLPPDAATLPIVVSRRRSRRDDSEYRWRTVWIASG